MEILENKITIHYFKSSGDIYAIATGEQHIDVYYGERSPDFKIILDELIIPYDEYVLRNSRMFKVNTETKQLELRQNAIPNYPIAAQ